jgi:glyoxylase-like metal-dependent hydrolase (beta-lactamase superfamily II)
MPNWFTTTPAAPGVFLTTEPHVNSFFRANCYTVQGRDADLQFDFGSGLLPYRPALPLTCAPVLAIASHAHIDHVGGFHEFATRLGHASEAQGFADMNDTATLKHLFRNETFGPSLTREPHPGFRLADWTLTPAPLTGTLAEGDRIDLGSRSFTVLHLPGHSPGGIGLLDELDGLLLAGDAVYDDDLLDDIPGASVPDYLATMTRLLTLDCRLVLAGHGAPFGQQRLRAIAQSYIRSKD